MPIQDLLAKIAKGPKASKDLTWDEAKQAMRALIEGEATPAQVGAFLVAMRFKMESVTELAAFTAAARSYVPPSPSHGTWRLSMSRPMPASKTPFTRLLPASIVAVAAGGVVLMHGYDGIPGRPGSAGVLKTLGIPIDLDPKAVSEHVAAKRLRHTWTSRCTILPSTDFWRCGKNSGSGMCSIRSPGC